MGAKRLDEVESYSRRPESIPDILVEFSALCRINRHSRSDRRNLRVHRATTGKPRK